VLGLTAKRLLRLSHWKRCWLGLELGANVRRLIFTMTMRIRLALVFVIQEHATNVRVKEQIYVWFNFVAGKRDSSEINDRDIKTTTMWM